MSWALWRQLVSEEAWQGSASSRLEVIGSHCHHQRCNT